MEREWKMDKGGEKLMTEKRYRIHYKDGNTLDTAAYSMSLEGGKLYQCTRSYPFENGEISVCDGTQIESVEEVDECKRN
jgi:major membrane immunogen (membrane-anchored lipoprotein)